MQKFVFLFLVMLPLAAVARQVSPDIREGNWAFRDGKAAEAEVAYRKALEADPRSPEATFNLGNSLYAQGKVEDALEAYGKAASLTDDKRQLSSIYHNMGNGYYQRQDYGKSAEAYKRALKANPDDEDTRYNLAMALKQIQRQQQQQQQQRQDNQDQQDKRENKEQDQRPPEPREPEEGMSKENARQILDAFQQEEQELKDKMQRQQGDSQRNLEKDW